MKRLLAVVALAIACAGCADPLRGMRIVSPSQPPDTAPPPGKAAVVFLRPSDVGYTASVLELKKDGDHFVGHVLSFKKVFYVTDPGSTRFMIIGSGRADFMDAELSAGKTYYTLVTNRDGMGFSLRPVTKGDTDLQRWLNDSAWIETGPAAQAWAKAHWNAIQSRKTAGLPRWETKPDRAMLRAGDGR